MTRSTWELAWEWTWALRTNEAANLGRHDGMSDRLHHVRGTHGRRIARDGLVASPKRSPQTRSRWAVRGEQGYWRRRGCAGPRLFDGFCSFEHLVPPDVRLSTCRPDRGFRWLAFSHSLTYTNGDFVHAAVDAAERPESGGEGNPATFNRASILQDERRIQDRLGRPSPC